MNWTETLEELIYLDNHAPQSTVYPLKATAACGKASNWGCCSVAEKMLDIDEDWKAVGDSGRSYIIAKYRVLQRLGSHFYHEVCNHDWGPALELHKKIQKHRIDKQYLHSHIKSIQ